MEVHEEVVTLPVESYEVSAGQNPLNGQYLIVLAFIGNRGRRSPNLRLSLEHAKQLARDLQDCIAYAETPKN